MLRLVKNLDLHFVESRMLCFASAQSMNWEDPSWTRCSRFRRTSACQDGDGTSFGLRQRLSQIASSALSFSAVVIWSSGRVTSMEHPPAIRSDGSHDTRLKRTVKAKRTAQNAKPENASAVGRLIEEGGMPSVAQPARANTCRIPNARNIAIRASWPHLPCACPPAHRSQIQTDNRATVSGPH